MTDFAGEANAEPRVLKPASALSSNFFRNEVFTEAVCELCGSTLHVYHSQDTEKMTYVTRHQLIDCVAVLAERVAQLEKKA